MNCPYCRSDLIRAYRTDRRKYDVRKVYSCDTCNGKWSDQPDRDQPAANVTRRISFRGVVSGAMA